MPPRLLGIKKPTVGTVGKDHFKEWRERKTDNNIGSGSPARVDSYNYLLRILLGIQGFTSSLKS
jgi:hypothetical protein